MVRSWSSASVSAGKPPSSSSACAPPGAHRARHHGQRVQRAERPPLQILRHDIFQRLPAGDHVDAVADLGVARHRAHLADRRTSAPAAKSCRLLNWVSASSATTTSPWALARPTFSALALPPLGMEITPTRRLAHEMRAHDIGGVIRRAVVDHQHFQIAIIAGQDALDRGDDHLLFVEGGDQHRDRLAAGRRAPARRALAQPVGERQAAQHQQPAHAQDDGADEAIIKKLAQIGEGQEHHPVGIEHHGGRQRRHHLVAA